LLKPQLLEGNTRTSLESHHGLCFGYSITIQFEIYCPYLSFYVSLFIYFFVWLLLFMHFKFVLHVFVEMLERDLFCRYHMLSRGLCRLSPNSALSQPYKWLVDNGMNWSSQIPHIVDIRLKTIDLTLFLIIGQTWKKLVWSVSIKFFFFFF